MRKHGLVADQALDGEGVDFGLHGGRVGQREPGSQVEILDKAAEAFFVAVKG
jgi:hypothetical protein